MLINLDLHDIFQALSKEKLDNVVVSAVFGVASAYMTTNILYITPGELNGYVPVTAIHEFVSCHPYLTTNILTYYQYFVWYPAI